MPILGLEGSQFSYIYTFCPNHILIQVIQKLNLLGS